MCLKILILGILQTKGGGKVFKEIFEGLMLGDGHLSKRAVSANYAHSCKHRDYLEWLQKCLVQQQISVNPKIYKKDEGRGIYYQMYSCVDSFLTEQHKRWYSGKKKIVPIDIKLTPENVLHWYIGDGGLDSDKGYLRQIKIASHSFTYEERQLLVDNLKELGFKASNRKGGCICICKSSIKPFLDWIGLPPVESFLYKWDITKYQSKQPKYN